MTDDPELYRLAQYVVAPSGVLLEEPGTTMWAAARLLDGLVCLAKGSRTEIATTGRAAVHRRAPARDAVRAWPDLESPYFDDDAAFLMGLYAFSENYCDTGLRSVAHMGSIVIPSLLVAAQARPIAGRDALAAIVMGYEIMEYLGGALNGGQPRMGHQLRGFRPTATVGPITAVAVLARMAGWSVDECVQALALACSQGGGLRRSPIAPTAAIRVQSGEALRRAVTTLDLAEAGIVSDPDVLWADGGFFSAYRTGQLGQVQAPVAGRSVAVRQASMKLDATPHTFASVLDGVRAIGSQDHLEEPAVASVVVHAPRAHITISGGTRGQPKNWAEAAGHIRFCVALALLHPTHLYPAVLDGAVGKADVQRLTERVTFVEDDELSRVFENDGGSWPARVEVHLADGQLRTAALRAPDSIDWDAQEALAYAAQKGRTLLGVPEAEQLLRDRFADIDRWVDVWEQLRDDEALRSVFEGESTGHGD